MNIMKKMLTFIPLAIGISAALIYIFNVVQFQMVGSATTLLDSLTRLRMYLYIAIISFIIYFIIKVVLLVLYRRNRVSVTNEVITDNSYEPFEEAREEIKEEPKVIIKEKLKHCINCNELINKKDKYCFKCGANQKQKKKILTPFIKSIINILEIVILILVIYFLLNMLFDYKEKQDPDFRSPFKIGMTK